MKRRYIAIKDGNPVWHASTLGRHGLGPSAILPAELERDVQEILQRQRSEISQISQYCRSSPGSIRKVGNKWTATESAPPQIRNLLRAWEEEPMVQAALERLAEAPSQPQNMPVAATLPYPAPSSGISAVTPDRSATVGVGIPGDGRPPAAERSSSAPSPRQRLSSYEQILVAAAEARKKHDARWRRSRRLDMPDPSNALGSPGERKPDPKEPRKSLRPFPPGRDFGR